MTITDNRSFIVSVRNSRQRYATLIRDSLSEDRELD